MRHFISKNIFECNIYTFSFEELPARGGGLDGRVQGVLVQAAPAVPQHRRRRHERAARYPREAQVQAVLVVHARGGVGPREVLPDYRATAFCCRRGICNKYEPSNVLFTTVLTERLAADFSLLRHAL